MSEYKKGGVPLLQVLKANKAHVDCPEIPVKRVVLNDGTAVLSGYVKPGVSFNIWSVCGSKALKGIVLESLVFRNSEGKIEYLEIRKTEPVTIRGSNFTTGYVTKINNLRWGFQVEINEISGTTMIKVDPNSPVIGVSFYLT